MAGEIAGLEGTKPARRRRYKSNSRRQTAKAAGLKNPALHSNLRSEARQEKSGRPEGRRYEGKPRSIQNQAKALLEKPHTHPAIQWLVPSPAKMDLKCSLVKEFRTG